MSDLNVLSTRYELENCSDEVLERSLDAVSRDVVKDYIFHLRKENAALKAMLTSSAPGPPIVCTAPPPLPTLPEEEVYASSFKSQRAEVKFTAHFSNQTGGPVNLIWKDYDGKEVLIKMYIEKEKVHSEMTYLSHPFLARDSVTKKLKKFNISVTEGHGVVFKDHFKQILL